MGYLLIDHRSTVDPTGTRDGVLFECDTVSCPHCQSVIKKVVTGPCRTKIDSPGECDHCRKPICRDCAARLQANEICPGEMKDNIDRAWQQFNQSQTLFFEMRS